MKLNWAFGSPRALWSWWKTSHRIRTILHSGRCSARGRCSTGRRCSPGGGVSGCGPTRPCWSWCFGCHGWSRSSGWESWCRSVRSRHVGGGGLWSFRSGIWGRGLRGSRGTVGRVHAPCWRRWRQARLWLRVCDIWGRITQPFGPL